MIRSFDAGKFNEIANHPEVKPWLGFHSSHVIDFTDLVGNGANYCFLTPCGRGGYMLHNQGGGHYVAHTLAMPEARGRPMHRLMQAGFEFLFVNTDCVEISTLVPDGNEAALRWTELAGFREVFRRETLWNCLIDDKPVGGTFFNQSFEDWVGRAPGLKAEGEKFHELIEAAVGKENHPDDPIHDRYVGATILGCRAGNAPKAIQKYNRWAKLTGYQPATILNIHPLLLNIGNAILQMAPADIEVLRVLD